MLTVQPFAGAGTSIFLAGGLLHLLEASCQHEAHERRPVAPIHAVRALSCA